MLPTTLLQELFDLRWYIQHLIDESESDDDDLNNPPNQDNWLLQTRRKFMKYVIYNGHTMTHKHVDKNPGRQITKANPHHKHDTDEGSLPNLQDHQNVQYLAHLQELQRIEHQLKHLKFQTQ